MGCIYSDFEGNCSLWDNKTELQGCDKEGACCCEDDPSPSDTCESYESNWACSECEADLNNDECNCEEE